MKLIVAIDQQGAIGRQGDLLCHLRQDLLRFKELTMGGQIVMGRKTWESFPRRPLPGRHNIIITHALAYEASGATVVHSLDEAVQLGHEKETQAEWGPTWIIGGGSIYREAIGRDLIDEMEITRIHHRFEDADTFFPTIDETVWRRIRNEEHAPDEQNPYPYSFETWVKIK